MPKPRVKRHAVTQPLDESIRLIPLTQGQNAIVDAADFEFLSQFNWSALWQRNTKSFYANRGGPNRSPKIMMHRAILNCQKGDVVDHRNKNTLDNRRENLRLCTASQNQCNRARTVSGASGFKGVTYKKETGHWCAQIQVNGQAIYLGRFAFKEEAAKAYDRAAKVRHGEFARLNFPI